MRRRRLRASSLLTLPVLCGGLAGCADSDRVTFVTSTKIAVDADATTQSVDLGYGRYEGFVGPAYPATGAVPPIVGKLSSNISVLDPKVKQFYATGWAAVLATCKGGTATRGTGTTLSAECPVPNRADHEEFEIHRQRHRLKGDRRLMFFGTSSVIGFRASWAGNVPEAVTLGYKRKEFSWLPIGRKRRGGTQDGNAAGNAARSDEQVEDVYGSVLASLDLGVSAMSEEGTPAPGPFSGRPTLAIDQFFATGRAAEQLAATDRVKQSIGDAVGEATEGTLELPGVEKTGDDAVEDRAGGAAGESVEQTSVGAGAERRAARTDQPASLVASEIEQQAARERILQALDQGTNREAMDRLKPVCWPADVPASVLAAEFLSLSSVGTYGRYYPDVASCMGV